MNVPETLAQQFDAGEFRLSGGQEVVRRLSDLKGCFADSAAYEAALRENDPVLYRVIAVEPANGAGDLHFGLGILYPGKIGREYFLTKGHLHQTREAAEVYIGQTGEGFMILEDEQTGATRLEPLGAGRIVYVPGHTAHRTVNTGRTPLTYFGVYPANAGHDYGAIASRNFLKVVIEEDGRPVLCDRSAL
ncbi:MAG: glucose-6-phosphate isomerase family protein [Terrimicrobiaceae bacterium]|nr:glucose-6-phosphate isomerase family protein [Terrimicrobiaceae bacterium]